jgi:hypothetical protein
MSLKYDYAFKAEIKERNQISMFAGRRQQYQLFAVPHKEMTGQPEQSLVQKSTQRLENIRRLLQGL